VPECDSEDFKMRRHWPNRGWCAVEKEMLIMREFRLPRRGVNEVFALWNVR
jgi:hypothetical protein